MAAIGFRCPDGNTVKFGACDKCDHRCMALPALKSAENSTHHWFGKPSVTTLLTDTRQTYLKITSDFYVNPMGSIAAMIGTSMHSIMEGNTPQNWLSEVRLNDDITSGAFDAYDTETQTLYDFKCYGAYKISQCLGFKGKWEKYIVTRGKDKGKEKWRQRFVPGGVRHLHDVAFQLNYYRILMEKHGIPVRSMAVQCFVRGGLDKTAKSYGITQAAYLIPVNKISDHWVRLYFKTKYDRLMDALEKKELPPICKDRWGSKSNPDRRCKEYCEVNENCPYYIEHYGGKR